MEIGYHAKSKSQLEDLFSSNTFGTADKHRDLRFKCSLNYSSFKSVFPERLRHTFEGEGRRKRSTEVGGVFNVESQKVLFSRYKRK